MKLQQESNTGRYLEELDFTASLNEVLSKFSSPKHTFEEGSATPSISYIDDIPYQLSTCSATLESTNTIFYFKFLYLKIIFN
jgi:hypothetical protein